PVVRPTKVGQGTSMHRSARRRRTDVDARARVRTQRFLPRAVAGWPSRGGGMRHAGNDPTLIASCLSKVAVAGEPADRVELHVRRKGTRDAMRPQATIRDDSEGIHAAVAAFFAIKLCDCSQFRNVDGYMRNQSGSECPAGGTAGLPRGAGAAPVAAAIIERSRLPAPQ